jgi:hypothetical protein
VNRITTLKSIQNGIAVLKRRSGASLSSNGWRSASGQVIKELEGLNRGTERDFLVAGQKLIEFRTLARQIASDMSALTELISGEQSRQASQALARILEHCRQMDSRIEQGGEALGQVGELSRRVRAAFTGLRHTVAVFRTLCTLTRIETARLGGAGADLGHLTAEVGPLSESIQSSGEGVLEASGRLDQDVRSALVSGLDLRRTQLKELPALIAGLIESLKSLEERQRLAAEASGRQMAEYTAVCEAMDDLVSSIQFHDITRQQVEHVIEALRHLRSEGQSPAGKPKLSSPQLSSEDAGIILTLQSRQLSEAARLFAASVGRMLGDLDRIAVRAESTPEASRSLLGISSDGQESFFLKLETQFSAIVKMLDACITALSGMEATGVSLNETIGHMRNSVAEIRGTEIRIQRISTNATIRATHIGAAGVALNKIAEVMQRLALESSGTTEGAAGTLNEMSDAAGRVSGGAETAASLTKEVIDEMRTTIGQLHSSSESSFSRVNEIVALSARLAGELAALRSGFSAGRMFAETVERARIELESMGAGHADVASKSSSAETAQKLERFAATYTMQRQREVHESVVGGSPVPDAPLFTLRTERSVVKEGDLGENVELF